jgi:hypothetical protein
MDTTRAQLKTLNTQMAFFTKQKVAAKTNLISLLDMTYPGVNDLFDSQTRNDGSEKWVDYAASFWHADCVRKIGLKAFTERYRSFCKRHGYNFQSGKPEELYNAHREALTAFAGVDPGVNQSGSFKSNSNNASKCGPARLRKTLFLIMSSLLQTKPADDPVYLFLDKKRSEGKPYLVYMTAGANKFLRIYYGKVKACLREKGLPDLPTEMSSNEA